MTVTPSESAASTLDVDGVVQSVTFTVVDPLEVVDSGPDDGTGRPFMPVKKFVEGESFRL